MHLGLSVSACVCPSVRLHTCQPSRYYYVNSPAPSISGTTHAQFSEGLHFSASLWRCVVAIHNDIVEIEHSNTCSESVIIDTHIHNYTKVV